MVAPTSTPRLVRLVVRSATPVSGTADDYITVYAPQSQVEVRAITEPPLASDQVVWRGGRPDTFGRTIPRSQLTPPDRPIVVSATLGGQTREVRVIIRPQLVTFTVANAIRSNDDPSNNEQVFKAEYSKDGPPVTITAQLRPDTPTACGYLRWTGGSSGVHAGQRLVLRNCLTPPNAPVRVRAALNPWWDFIVYVVPRVSGARKMDSGLRRGVKKAPPRKKARSKKKY